MRLVCSWEETNSRLLYPRFFIREDIPFASAKVPKNPSLIFMASTSSAGTPNSLNLSKDHSSLVKFLLRDLLYSVFPGLLKIHILLHIPLRNNSEAVLYLNSRLLWEPPNTYIASTFVLAEGGLIRINSSDNKYFKSALTWLALLLFSHMMDNVKANKALNEMKNIGFEKKRWLFLESILECFLYLPGNFFGQGFCNSFMRWKRD